MIDLNITYHEKTATISALEDVFNFLFTLPPWKLPQTQSKMKPALLGCLMEVHERACQELIPVFRAEFKKTKETFDKNLSETGHADNSLTENVLIPGHFKITRSVRIQDWKFELQVSLKENTEDFLFVLLSSIYKPKNSNSYAPPKISKHSLVRDLNKNRATAGNKQLEQLVKRFQGSNGKLS